MTLVRRELAPAKVNLFLHVGVARPDGYHPVGSWMVFADLGDVVALAPAPDWKVAVEGPFAGAIGSGENLVEQAARLLFARAGIPPPPCRLTLTKTLPVAAGLGGGSSDAGAALRALNGVLVEPLAQVELLAIAAELGADGPACLLARPALATDRGDRLAPAPPTPPLPVVLVNPRRPCPTGAVYRAYDAGPGRDPHLPDLPEGFDSPEALAGFLQSTRNDLQAPAVALEPAIGAVLEGLRSRRETLFARMSGSGATCFALCSSHEDAERLAAAVGVAEPGWWVRPCILSGPITKS